MKGKKDKKLLSFADDDEAPGLDDDSAPLIAKKMVQSAWDFESRAPKPNPYPVSPIPSVEG